MEHKKSGQMFHDNIEEIQASLDCILNGLCGMAYDASALDQHIGTGDRQVFLDVVETFLVAEGAGAQSEFFKEFGIQYFEWVKAWATKRLQNYFTIQVPGAPTQAFMCNTQASGERLTGIINTIVSKAIVDWVETMCMDIAAGKAVGGIWGDDIWRKYLFGTITPENVMEKLAQFEEGGKLCGQSYSYEKALSGTLIHFLQNVFKAGQTFSRSVALTHERWFTVHIRALSSLLAKIDKICHRGGNYRTCKVWKMAYLCSASQTSVFGKKFIYPPGMIVYPGGVLNQVLLPFASQNSRAWLSLNARNLGFTGTMIAPPSAENNREIGARILESLEVEKKPTKVKICGREIEIPSMKSALEESFTVMTDPERIPGDGDVASATRRALKTASIYEWNTNQFTESLGVSVSSGVHSKWFKEQEMMKMGAFPGDKGSEKRTATVKLKQHTIEPKYSYRIGDHSVNVSYSGLRITMTKSAKGSLASDYIFNLRRLDDSLVKTWKGRWHCFYTSPASYVTFLLWSGIAGKSASVGTSKDALLPFSPSKFRPDLTADAVVNLIMQGKREDRTALLAGMGFKSTEITEMNLAFQGVGELRDEEDFDEWSSTPGPLKSASRDRLQELLAMPEIFQTKDAGGYDILDGMTHGVHLKQAVLHLLTEMCYTEANISCNINPSILRGLTSEHEVDLFNIPRFELSALT
jgi:hypothetical protein